MRFLISLSCSDLEKVADYITFIHQGKVLFCKTKDELRYHYGVIRCGAALFDQIDKTEILAYRKDDYQWNVLVSDKEKAKRKYKNAIAFIPTSGVEGYIFGCAILCSMMIVTTFSFDDASKWTRYAMITPISGKDLVAGKFTVLAIFCAIGSLFGMVVGSIGGVILKKVSFDPAGIGKLLFLTLVAWVISLILVVYQSPLYSSLGRKKDMYCYWYRFLFRRQSALEYTMDRISLQLQVFRDGNSHEKRNRNGFSSRFLLLCSHRLRYACSPSEVLRSTVKMMMA